MVLVWQAVFVGYLGKGRGEKNKRCVCKTWVDAVMHCAMLLYRGKSAEGWEDSHGQGLLYQYTYVSTLVGGGV